MIWSTNLLLKVFLGTQGAGGCLSGLFRNGDVQRQRRTLVLLCGTGLDFLWADFWCFWSPLPQKYRVRLSTNRQVDGLHSQWQVKCEGFNRDGYRQLRRKRRKQWNPTAGVFELTLCTLWQPLRKRLYFFSCSFLLLDGAVVLWCWTVGGPQWRKWAGALDLEALNK